MDTLVADRPIVRANDSMAGMSKLEVNGWTFMYDPNEIAMTSDLCEYLGKFRTEDGETVFVVTADDEGIIIY